MTTSKWTPRYDDIRSLFINEKVVHYKKGEVLARPSHEPSGLFLIEKGLVKAYTISDGGSEYVHIIYKQGEIFPFIWAMRGRMRNVFYEALGPVRVRVMPRRIFLELIEEDHPACQMFLGRLTDQFNVLADRLDNLEYSRARDRVVYRLLFLAGRFGEKQGRSIIINAPVTQQLMASTLNLQRETVSREIEALEAEGLIRYDKHKLVIRSIKKLAAQISEPVSQDLWGMK